MILWRNWGGWHALNVFFFRFKPADDHFRIEYVAFTLMRGNSKSDTESLKRFRIALKRKVTIKDNKALRSVIFITKFTKILAKMSIDVCRVSLLATS